MRTFTPRTQSPARPDGEIFAGSDSGGLSCSCLRDPQPSTIQDFNYETLEYQEERLAKVTLDNCSASHYTILMQLGEIGVFMRKFTFKNFVSLKLIIDGEIKENVTVDIENFNGVFGNVLGQVELKGIVRCFGANPEDGGSGERKSLRINVNRVDTVTISNFFIKDLDNACDVFFSVSDSSKFTVKESKFNKNISGSIVSRQCIRNKDEVDCSLVLEEHGQSDFTTVQAVMLFMGILALGSISFIVSKVPL